MSRFLSFRSDVSSNFEIDIEVYGLVSVLHLMVCVSWFHCLFIVHLGEKAVHSPLEEEKLPLLLSKIIIVAIVIIVAIIIKYKHLKHFNILNLFYRWTVNE